MQREPSRMIRSLETNERLCKLGMFSLKERSREDMINLPKHLKDYHLKERRVLFKGEEGRR